MAIKLLQFLPHPQSLCHIQFFHLLEKLEKTEFWTNLNFMRINSYTRLSIIAAVVVKISITFFVRSCGGDIIEFWANLWRIIEQFLKFRNLNFPTRKSSGSQIHYKLILMLISVEKCVVQWKKDFIISRRRRHAHTLDKHRKTLFIFHTELNNIHARSRI